MKKKNLIALLAMLVFLTAIGCKREATISESGIQGGVISEKVKSWFESKPTPFANSAGKTITESDLSISRPAREKTRFYPNENIYITPIALASKTIDEKSSVHKYLLASGQANGEISGGSYFYVMADKKDEALNTRAQNLTPDFFSLEQIPTTFSGAILQYDLKNNIIFGKHYEEGKPVNRTDKLSYKKSEPGSNSNFANPDECGGEGTQVCIDWYWQTWVNGVLVYEEYLYTTCSCVGTGGGGGGGNGPTTAQLAADLMAQIENPNNVRSIGRPTTEIYATNQERARYYPWGFYFIPGLPLLGSAQMQWSSIEKGTQRNTGGTFPLWYWTGLDHIETYKEGANFGLNVNISAVHGSPILNTGGDSKLAIMNLTFQISYTFVLNNLNFGNDFVGTASKAWLISTGWPIVEE